MFEYLEDFVADKQSESDFVANKIDSIIKK